MDLNYKIKKIKSLNDEVNNFHPLLHQLFQSMPSITGVEYTHGPNEKGADFVLTKYDDIIGDTFYIGIIVKIGKIQIDFTDIERQIEECELPRTILGGKKSIRLSEIWVITNESVSNNAEEKIYHKFANRKILFIENDRIINWIDSYLPNYWFDYNITVGKYLENIHNHMIVQDKQFNLLICANEPFYIEQDIYLRDFDYKFKKNKKSKRKKVDILEIVKSEKISIIEAGMGGGKSKLIREIVKHYSNGENYSKYKLLPITISYKEFIEKYNNDVNNLLRDPIYDQVLMNQEKESKILLLIDAIDEWEATHSEQITALTKTIKTISESPNLHAVLTTRQIQGIHKDKDFIGKVAIYEIYPLTINKLLQFLYKICQLTNLSSRIIEDLQKSQLFKELPKTPIAAMILANLLDENSKELPANITELYSKYIELMLGRWDIGKGLQSQKEYEAADSVSQLLSEFFIDNNLFAMNLEEAKTFFHSYLSQRNIGIDSTFLFEKVINRSGIFVEDTINKTIMFKHRTFAEYLYARYHERKNSLKIDNRIYHPYWDSIFFFYVGIKKDCPDLLKEIIALKPLTEPQQWNRIINLSNFLLAGFSSPYIIVQENLYKIIIEAVELYQKILKKENDSPFMRLSEIQILFLFQMVIRESYSYEFFKEAIDSLNICIDDSDIPEEQKIIGLFFAGVIAMDSKYKNPFDFLISKYDDKIPIQIKLAISHEAERLEHISTYIKKSQKKFNKIIKDSKATRFYIESLYITPIGETKDIKKIT
jgi:hypothetical protein